jgi:hypothetical protein
VESSARYGRSLSTPKSGKKFDLHLGSTPELPRYIITDEKKLRQVLINLLSNATQFTTIGDVKLTAEFQDNDLFFQVVDTGPGIPQAYQAMLFKPFTIAASQQNHDSGTGIGLAISQQLTEILGGELRLVSSSDAGSTFELRLPKSAIVQQQIVTSRQVFDVRSWLVTLQQAATHLNAYSCRQLLLEPPRALDSAFLETISGRVERFDFDRVVMLTEEKLSSFATVHPEL